jgi:hypothetical protein
VRLQSFVGWALELMGKQPNRALWKEAMEKARRLAKHGVDEHRKSKGMELCERLDAFASRADLLPPDDAVRPG